MHTTLQASGISSKVGNASAAYPDSITFAGNALTAVSEAGEAVPHFRGRGALVDRQAVATRDRPGVSGYGRRKCLRRYFNLVNEYLMNEGLQRRN
jgi:hypothetical protein